MTLYSLTPHPDFPPLAVSGIEVKVRSDGTSIALAYNVTGGERLVVPPPATSARSDGLWKTTCFELFLKPAKGTGYLELNFAPSTQWATYAFDRYREGMRDLSIAAPVIGWVPDQLTATLRHPGLVPGSTAPRAPTGVAAAEPWTPEQVRGDGGDWAMAVTAVIEEEGGRKSYWSLAHPPGVPDFHHEACFAATLPAPGKS